MDSTSYEHIEEESLTSSSPMGEGEPEVLVIDQGTKTKGKRKTQFRFNKESDLVLVTEVENHKPFLETGKLCSKLWAKVAEVLNERFHGGITGYRAKLHFDLLIKQFRQDDLSNIWKSGTEEEITAIKSKLADLSQLLKDKEESLELEVVQKADKTSSDKKIVEDIREAAVTTMARKRKCSEDDESVPSKRNSEKNLIELWRDKQDRDREMQLDKIQREDSQRAEEIRLQRDELDLRKEQLDLDRAKLEFEQKRYEIDAKMQLERFELEKAERSAQLKNQESMLKLLASIIK